ncbi:MAG: hypothetical protein P1U63_02610 [Coxiellaceae bacterium]|nr:hypothetical protein [Coxiellaceae bacterium]
MKQGMVSIYMAYVAQNKPTFVRGSRDRFRGFVWAGDVVDAFNHCSLSDKAIDKVYNVSTGVKTYLWQLLDEIIKTFSDLPEQYPIELGEPKPNDQFGVFGSYERLKQDTGWQPSVQPPDGLESLEGWLSESNICNELEKNKEVMV